MKQFLISTIGVKPRAVMARTAQAAARKVLHPRARLYSPHPTSAGALLMASVTADGRFLGHVEESLDPKVVLVHYPERSSVGPFWANLDTWRDWEEHPITALTPEQIRR